MRSLLLGFESQCGRIKCIDSVEIRDVPNPEKQKIVRFKRKLSGLIDEVEKPEKAKIKQKTANDVQNKFFRNYDAQKQSRKP